MPKVFKQLANDEHNLIIEEVILEQKYLRNYEDNLKEYQVYFVNVGCELEVLEERKIKRRSCYRDKPCSISQNEKLRLRV